MVPLAAATGCRFGELVALERHHLNIRRRTVRVDQALKRTNPPSIGPPKTVAARRSMRLPEWVVSEMADHFARHAGDQWVFPSPESDLIRPSNWRRRVWLPAVALTVGEPCGFHALRHSHAAWLISEGVNAKAIQARLGHADVRTTLSVYGHMFEGYDDRSAEALDRVFATFQTDNKRTKRPKNVIPFAPT